MSKGVAEQSNFCALWSAQLYFGIVLVLVFPLGSCAYEHTNRRFSCLFAPHRSVTDFRPRCRRPARPAISDRPMVSTVVINKSVDELVRCQHQQLTPAVMQCHGSGSNASLWKHQTLTSDKIQTLEAIVIELGKHH